MRGRSRAGVGQRARTPTRRQRCCRLWCSRGGWLTLCRRGVHRPQPLLKLGCPHGSPPLKLLKLFQCLLSWRATVPPSLLKELEGRAEVGGALTIVGGGGSCGDDGGGLLLTARPSPRAAGSVLNGPWESWGQPRGGGRSGGRSGAAAAGRNGGPQRRIGEEAWQRPPPHGGGGRAGPLLAAEAVGSKGAEQTVTGSLCNIGRPAHGLEVRARIFNSGGPAAAVVLLPPASWQLVVFLILGQVAPEAVHAYVLAGL